MESKDDKSIPVISLHEKWVANQDTLRNFSISDWLKTFDGIYQNNTQLQSLSTIGFHLLEEAGEESRAIRHLVQLRDLSIQKKTITKEFIRNTGDVTTLICQYDKFHREVNEFFLKKSYSKVYRKRFYRKTDEEIFLKYRLLRAKMDLVNELADTFTWFSSVILKFLHMAKNMDKSKWFTKEISLDYDILDERIAKEYSLSIEEEEKNPKCHSCDKTECECKYYIKCDK